MTSLDAGGLITATELAVLAERLRQLERRVGRIEAFVLGLLTSVGLSVLGGMVSLLIAGPGAF